MPTTTAPTAPTRAACRPAPSLLTLVRAATTVDEPAWPRGTAGRSPAGCEPPLLWRTSTLIGCLALATGRRTAPAPELPYRFLDREFGRGRVTRFEDIDIPASVSHEPTRRFLRETGLPREAFPFRLDTDADLPLPTLAELSEDPALPAPASPLARLVRLGHLTDGGSVLVDGPTGTVLTWHGPTDTPRPLFPDLPAFALALWARHRATRMTAATGTGHRP